MIWVEYSWNLMMENDLRLEFSQEIKFSFVYTQNNTTPFQVYVFIIICFQVKWKKKEFYTCSLWKISTHTAIPVLFHLKV